MALYNKPLPTGKPGPALPASAWNVPKPPTIAGNLGNIGGVVKPNVNTQFANQPMQPQIAAPEQQAWGEQIYGKPPAPTAPTAPYDFQGAFNSIYSMNPQNIWSKIFGNNPMDGGFMGEFQNFLNNYRTKRWGRK